MDVIWCNRMLKMGYRLLSPQKNSGFDPFESPQVLHRWFRWSFPFSQQGGAPEKLCLLVYNPINYRYITYINHSYWSYVHQLNVIVAGGTTLNDLMDLMDLMPRERRGSNRRKAAASRTNPTVGWRAPGGGPQRASLVKGSSRCLHRLTPMVTYIYTGWWFQPLWKILVSWDYYSKYKEK